MSPFAQRLALFAAVGLLGLGVLATLLPGGAVFGAAVGTLLLGVAVYDFFQTDDPLRRNYPLVGRAHDLVHFMGKFFGLSDPSAPYSPAQVEVIQARARGEEALSAFGAMLPGGGELLHRIGALSCDAVSTRVLIGADRAQPYESSVLNISALAFGAMSEPALEALSRGAKQGGFALNTGEAGLPSCFLDGGGDLVWQLGTGYFGCRDAQGRFDPQAFESRARHDAVKMIEVKLSQGAKPSKGGLLLGDKITARIAEVCGIEAGRDSILPSRHSAFDSPRSLLAFLDELRERSGGKPVGIKLCIGAPMDWFALVKEMMRTGSTPDTIAIDGAQGGTGAAPIEFQSSVGMRLEHALPLVRDSLLGAGLHDRVRVIASGGITTAADMVRAMASGANLCAAARPFMIAAGCIQAQVCHRGTCPTGLASNRARLTRGIVPEAQARHIAQYQERTVGAFADLLAAMAIDDPAKIESGHVQGIVAPITVPGQLRDGKVPDVWRRAWDAADIDRF